LAAQQPEASMAQDAATDAEPHAQAAEADAGLIEQYNLDAQPQRP
jgi:hypothetical protein